MSTTDDQAKQDRIRQLKSELAELEGSSDRPLTLAEIRALSKEEVEQRWEDVQRSLASAHDASPAAAEEPSKETREQVEPVGVDRIARAYGAGVKDGRS